VIHIIIRARNAEKYIETCLWSLKKQTYGEWKGVLILDAPEDNTVKVASKYISLKNLPIELVVNRERKGLGYNLWYGIELIPNPHPEDIVCIVDGDDWIEKEALAVVISAYKKKNCRLTRGSYIKESKARITKVSRRDIKGPVRKTAWSCSHLKTFKYKLWQFFPKEYLQHNGVWAEAASDRGLMYGLVELAGIENCAHIKRPIYHWRNHKPNKEYLKTQKKWESIFRAKEPLHEYNTIPR